MGFDPIIANAGRLRILTALAAEPAQDFVRLRAATALTDGNLSSHARRLEAAGLIEIHKSFQNRKPQTLFRLTTTGRTALQTHAESILAAVAAPTSVAPPVAQADDDWVD